MHRLITRYRAMGVETKSSIIAIFMVINIASLILHHYLSIFHFSYTFLMMAFFAVATWIYFNVYLKSVNIQEKAFLSILVLGPFFVSILLWLNLLSAYANLSLETHPIKDYTYYRTRGTRRISNILVNFSDSAYQDYDGPRTFETFQYRESAESVTFHEGKGFLGIKVIFDRTFNFPKNEN